MIDKVNKAVELMKQIAGGNTTRITEMFEIDDTAIDFIIKRAIPYNYHGMTIDERGKELGLCTLLKSMPMVYRKITVDLYISITNNINHAVLVRRPSSVQGTLGVLGCSTGFICYTLECPDYDNKPFFSCAPIGSYTCEIKEISKFGSVYEIKDVPDRTDMLIHWGNWAGDSRQGLKTDSEGCVLVGRSINHVGQVMLQNSKAAYRQFMKAMNYQPFKLFIVEEGI